MAGKLPCNVKVKISLVMVESNRRKLSVSQTIRELSQFTIKVIPSSLPHKIQICKSSQDGMMNGTGREGNLELAAKAGSILKGLVMKAFNESGRLLSEVELKNAQIMVTTSWSGEVGIIV